MSGGRGSIREVDGEAWALHPPRSYFDGAQHERSKAPDGRGPE